VCVCVCVCVRACVCVCVCAVCKLLPTDTFLSRKMQEMRLGAESRPLGELIQRSRRPPSWIKGAYL